MAEKQKHGWAEGVTIVADFGDSIKTAAYSALPAEHPFYAAIGRVASEWAHLEHTLDAIIWSLADGPDHQTACVTAQIMGVGPRCKAIIALGRMKGGSDRDLKPFRTLMSESYPVADWRSRWVHDPWYIEQHTGIPGQFRSMPHIDPRFGIHTIEEDRLSETLDKIKALRWQANEAWTSLQCALRDKPPQEPI